MSKEVALKPRVSEKTYALSEERNTYVFEVPSRISKHEIAKAVTSQYEVGVTSVRMASLPGKNLRSYRRKGRVTHRGFKSGIRKAYVTLKEGDKLPIFAAVEEPNKPEDKKSGGRK
jgi:large subunit ribosomal protein L23